jgi:uncharacterized protein YdhG (YjbR/CyaY superfamily)
MGTMKSLSKGWKKEFYHDKEKAWMEGGKNNPQTIDEYIADFPQDIQTILQAVRQIIREAIPQASEKISWQMPTFYYHGNVIHFAGQKNHLGIYPGASGVEHFLEELKEYQTSKGAIQIPYKKPLPQDLIKRIATFRLEENIAIAQEKKIQNRK